MHLFIWEFFFWYGLSTHLNFRVSYLQFDNVTLILAEKSWGKIRSLKAILILFEIIFGLKVNFHKSLLVGINVEEYWLLEYAAVFNCKVGQLPFIYSGLPIDSNSCRLSF